MREILEPEDIYDVCDMCGEILGEDGYPCWACDAEDPDDCDGGWDYDDFGFDEFYCDNITLDDL